MNANVNCKGVARGIMRLDKMLAHCGLGTRKEVRALIKKKQVTVDGTIITDSGFTIDVHQNQIMVDNVPYTYEEYIYLMMNKQAGVVSAREDKVEKTIFDTIDAYYYQRGLFPVGRLDKDTTGLLLLTNDGVLSHQLLAPKKHVDKIYQVTIATPLTEDNIKQLELGITLEDGYQCLPAKVEMQDELTIRLTIKEGKFHQVKRMLTACDNKVLQLKRVQMGPLILDETLSEGMIRPLTEREKQLLLSLK